MPGNECSPFRDFEIFLRLCRKARWWIKVEPGLDLGPAELFLMGANGVSLRSKQGKPYSTQLECSHCGYFTTHWDKMTYHCKLPTHRYYVHLAERLSDQVDPLVKVEPKAPAIPVFDPKKRPVFKVAIKSTLDTMLKGEETRDPRPVSVLLYQAFINPTDALLCGLCSVKCDGPLEYALHMQSYPHEFRVCKLRESQLQYFQPFRDPSSKSMYILSITDKKIIHDGMVAIRNTSTRICYDGITQMSEIVPEQLGILLNF